MKKLRGAVAAFALLAMTLALSGCMQATDPFAGYKYFSYGTFVDANGGTTSNYFSYPRGIAVVGPGNIYVVDSYHNRIVKLSSISADSSTWTSWHSSSNGNVTLSAPEGIAVDSSATNIWIADSAHKRIVHLASGMTSDGANVSTFTGVTVGGIPYNFDYPTGVALNGTTLYVTDPGTEFPENTPAIYKIDVSSGFSGSARVSGRGSGAYQFSYPRGIAVDSTGTNVYVADETNYRIDKMNSSFSSWATLGTRGSGTGQFLSPQTVAVDSSGDIYVVDSGNYWVVKMTGISGAGWTLYGSQTGYSSDSVCPNWVTVDSGYIYVCDDYFQRIAAFQ